MIDQDTVDWMRCLYHEARSKTKCIPILAQCTCLTHSQVRAVLGLPQPVYKKASTKKERAIDLLNQGYSQVEVAAEVGVIPETVGNWMRQAMEEGRLNYEV